MAFMILTVGAAVATKFGVLAPGVAQRTGMIAIGMVMVVAGNFVPKMRLFDYHGARPARALAARRFSGWALVMAGLAIVGVWIVSPGRETALASSLIGLGAFALIAGAWAWVMAGPREAATRERDDDAVAKAARHALIWILFGLFWAQAIIFTARMWGDQASMWTTIAFGIIIALAPVTRLKSRR